MARPPKYSPEYAKQAEKLCYLGATDVEVADFFGINTRTLYRWQLQYPALCHALQAGKEHANERVVRSLYHRATGYTFETEKIFQFQGKVVRAKTVEHCPPDTSSMIFWLKNRQPDKWRDRLDTVHDVTPALGERLDAALKRLSSPKKP